MAVTNASLMDAIAGMTVLELSALIKEMEEKFGVSAAAVAVAGPAGGGALADPHRFGARGELAAVDDQVAPDLVHLEHRGFAGRTGRGQKLKGVLPVGFYGIGVGHADLRTSGPRRVRRGMGGIGAMGARSVMTDRVAVPRFRRVRQRSAKKPTPTAR